MAGLISRRKKKLPAELGKNEIDTENETNLHNCTPYQEICIAKLRADSEIYRLILVEPSVQIS
jgi:hypothetical protein